MAVNVRSNTVLINAVFVIALFVVSLITLFASNVYWMTNFHFWVYICIIVVSVINNKNISVDIMWIAGFIFIVLSEMLFAMSSESNLIVSKYILLGNDTILLSYYCFKEKHRFRENEYIISNNFWLAFFLGGMLLSYVLVMFPKVVLTMQYGRYTAERLYSGSLLTTIVSDLSYVLPGFIGFFFKKRRGKRWFWSLLFSSPVFVILILCGTRFPLLFSLMSWIIGSEVIEFSNIKKRDVIYLLVIAFLFMVIGSIMTTKRVSGMDPNTSKKKVTTNLSVSQRIVSYGSVEGILTANVWLHDYCQKNGFTYGKQSAFIFYWWVPRRIWPNKPKMTGGWLPQLYGTFGEGHSASVGLWGELYVDFGYFSFIFFIIFGGIMRRMDSYCKYLEKNAHNVDILKVPILLSYAFFGVRSPITGFIALCCSFGVFLLIRTIAFKKVNV